MTPINLFNRYLWLIELLSYSKGLSKKEIDLRWRNSGLNDDTECKEIPRRTFIRMKEAIYSLFDIEIKYNRFNDKYFIEESLPERNKNIRNFLLSAFSVNHLLRESRNLGTRIFLEETPLGSNLLLPEITTAMRENHRLFITYQSYDMQTTRKFEISPYALRYSNHRWYLLARTDFHTSLRLYALDRMKEVTITEKSFHLPKDFDVSEYFSRFFDVMIIEGEVEIIRLKANKFRTPYLRSLPLHHSQKEIFPREFELQLVPTPDFLQALRSIGPDIEITHPKWLRKQFKDEAKMLAKRYSHK